MARSSTLPSRWCDSAGRAYAWSFRCTTTCRAARGPGVTTRMSNAVDANWTLGVVGGHSTDLLPELVGKWNDRIILEPRETKETPLREKCEWFTRRVDVAVAWSGPQKNPRLDTAAGRWGAELRHALDELQTPQTAENFLSNSSGQGRVPSSERERSIRGILTMWRWQLEASRPSV